MLLIHLTLLGGYYMATVEKQVRYARSLQGLNGAMEDLVALVQAIKEVFHFHFMPVTQERIKKFFDQAAEVIDAAGEKVSIDNEEVYGEIARTIGFGIVIHDELVARFAAFADGLMPKLPEMRAEIKAIHPTVFQKHADALSALEVDLSAAIHNARTASGSKKVGYGLSMVAAYQALFKTLVEAKREAVKTKEEEGRAAYRKQFQKDERSAVKKSRALLDRAATLVM